MALTASGLWYYQSMILYPASFPDGSRSGKPTIGFIIISPVTHQGIQHPAVDVPDPYDLFGIPYKNLTLPTPDGEHLAAYLIYARPAFEAKSILALSASRKSSKKEDEKVEVGEEESEGKLSKDGEDFVKSRPTVIMYHANAGEFDCFRRSSEGALIFRAQSGNMGHRLPLARAFWEGIECNVFMLSYRG